MMLSAERAREVFDYNPDTGALSWRVKTSPKTIVGREAGSRHNCGYRQVRVDGKVYLAHRVIWLLVTGSWPEREIDHINGDRMDNRLSNLRPCTPAQNRQNRAVAAVAGKLPGAYWHERDGKWMARIKVGGKTSYIGSFDSQHEAHMAYAARKRELHAFAPEIRYA